MDSNAIKRLLSTGLETYSGVLGTQVQAAREEEERRRLKNQETMAALLGYSLVGQRKASTAESMARTKKLGERELDEPDIKYTFDLGPGFKATTTSDEGVKKIAAGLGVDVESLFDQAATEDPYAGVKRIVDTPGGRISGPVSDDMGGLIESLGGISPEEPLKPTHVGDIYNQAMQLAVISAGGEDKWGKLSLPQQSEKMDFFARQLWEQYNPGVPYKGIEFPEIGQGQVPEEPGFWGRRLEGLQHLIGVGDFSRDGRQGAPTAESLSSAEQATVNYLTNNPEKIATYNWDALKAEHPDIDVEKIKRQIQ